MNDNDKEYWITFRENVKGYITHDEYRKISELHAFYFEHFTNYPCKCNPKIIQSYIDDLNKLFNEK